MKKDNSFRQHQLGKILKAGETMKYPKNPENCTQRQHRRQKKAVVADVSEKVRKAPITDNLVTTNDS